MLPYQPHARCDSTSSAPDLCPIIIHARPLDRRAVSHSLNEWLLPSQHPGCLCGRTSLLSSTWPGFGGLRRWSELFLSRTRTLAPAPLLPDIEWAAFGVRQDLIGGEALASYRSLYLRHSRPRLHLNTFRGVRAISKFDWPFTPTHRSSESFSTLTGSDLQTESPVLHPAHG